MTLKTSLIITGDASTAKAAVETLSRDVRALGTAGKEAAVGLAAQERAEEGATTAARAASAAQASLANELRQAQAAAAGYEAQLRDAQAAIGTLAGRVDVLETQIRGSSKATRDATGDAARHAAATRNLGQQFGDLAVMIQGGISPARAFATQAGQMGYAMSDMEGKAGAVGKFLVGPWGIALTVAVSALAPLVEKLFEAGAAADEQSDKLAQAVTAADSYGNAQSMLGKVIDLTTGKLKTQNSVLVQTIKLQAQANLLKAQGEIEAADPAKRKTLGQQFGEYLNGSGENRIIAGSNNAGIIAARGRQSAAQERYLASGMGQLAKLAGDTAAAQADPLAYNTGVQKQVTSLLAGLDRIAINGKVAGKSLLEVKQQVLSLGIAAGNQAANLEAITALDGGGLSSGLRQTKPKRMPKKKGDGAALAEFGRDAGDKIASIVGQFDDAPAAIDKANGKLRELDDLIEDLGRRKPVGFAKLVAEAEAAKDTVRSGLIAAVIEGFEKPKTLADKAAAAFGQLDAVIAKFQAEKPNGFENLVAEAKAARGAVEAALNKPFDDFIQAQRESASVNELLLSGRLVEAEALRQILAMEKTRGSQLLPEQRAVIVASTEALQLQERQLERNRAVQQVSLDALSDMKDIARQTIFEGPQALAKLPERLFASFKNYNADRLAEEWLGDMFRDLRDKVTGASKLDTASATVVSAFNKTAAAAAGLGAALDRAASGGSTAGSTANPAQGDEEAEVVVTGRKRSEVYGDTIANVLGKVGIGKDTSRELGKYAGKAMAGAFEGQAAAGVAGMFGIKTNGTGAAIGGALGGMTGLPGGAIVGGILGGIAGKLFGGKPKEYGTSTISIGDGAASASVGIGKGTAEREAATALGGSVAEGLNRIAEALGGSLSGSASVSIGYRPGHKAGAYRVDTTGAGRVTGVDAFESEAEAIAYAIRDAVADGAIAGLSAAVQRALSSSADVDKAVAEAIKVQELETAIGGPLATYQKAFRAFEAQAAERVRIATKYGFDVVAIDKRNAEERTKLAAELARAQIGSLQSLVDEITAGSLFEGSALDRIGAINEAIAKAKTDLDAGVEGAGDKLAGLYEQRLAASKDAYATTGGYAANRAATIGEAQAAIARVNAQVAASQAKSDPALTATNAALDENNDQNAQVIATLKQANTLLATIAAGGGGGGGATFNLAQLAAV